MALPKGTSKEDGKVMLNLHSLQREVSSTLRLLVETQSDVLVNKRRTASEVITKGNVTRILRILDGYSYNASRTYFTLLLADKLYLFILGYISEGELGDMLYRYENINFYYHERRQSKYIISNL